jgi:branched-chain amino acid transport system ATP-binding protein
MIPRVAGRSAERRKQRRLDEERRRFGPPQGWVSGQPVPSRPMLELRGLVKHFDGRRAIDGVDLVVRRGSVHALIGPNDAGKTTLLNLVTGVLSPDEGRVLIEGEDVTGAPAWKLTKLGVGRSFQQAELFWSLSPRDNVRLAKAVAAGSVWRPYGALPESITAESSGFLGRFGLGGLERWLSAGDLSNGDQRTLDLATSLAGRPRLLLLDEPTAGLSPRETKDAAALISRLAREEELTLVFVEHDMEVVFGIADWITVMHQGRVLAGGPPHEISENPAVRRAYLGDLAIERR